MKNVLSAFGLSMILAASACTQTADYDLKKWPADADPGKVGLLLSERYLATPHKSSGDVSSGQSATQIVYSEACTWLGSIWFAEASGNKELFTKLQERFEPLFETMSNLLPPPNHVDNNVFGSVPLEFYIVNGEKTIS